MWWNLRQPLKSESYDYIKTIKMCTKLVKKFTRNTTVTKMYGKRLERN